MIPTMVSLLVWGSLGFDGFVTRFALGSHPGTATAESFEPHRIGCGRKQFCFTEWWVTFHTSDGGLVEVPLSGRWDPVADVGEPLVYDERLPSRVATADEWARGTTWPGHAAPPLLALLALAGLVVARARIRRRRYGDLRPGVAVIAVERTTFTVKVRYTDGVSVRYVKTAPFIDALTAKISRDGSLVLGAGGSL